MGHRDFQVNFVWILGTLNVTFWFGKTNTVKIQPNSRLHNVPSISLTSSSGSSSLLHSEDSTSSSSSRSSSLNKIAKGASDIQHYASRYIDSIKTKSFSSSSQKSASPSRSSPAARSTSVRSSRSESPLYAGGSPTTSSVPYLLTFRQTNRLTPTTPVSTTPSSLLPPRKPYSLTPSPPPTSFSTSPKKSSESRYKPVNTGLYRYLCCQFTN